MPAVAAMLGYAIKDASLLSQALTHGSHNSKGAKSENDYQRLEFLGDRILGLVIAETLYHRFPEAREGDLSARLNMLVSGATCADVGRTMGLGPHIKLGKQARDDGARDSDNILGDVVESLIGATYLDGGLQAAQAVIEKHWGARLDSVGKQARHPKSILLEWAAANRKKPPVYALIDRQGPDHAPRFTVMASIANAGEVSASGASKQEAETAAAAALLTMLGVIQ